MHEEIQKQYELTLILSPELEEEEINLFQEEFKKNIEKLEGSLKKTGKPEKRSLSYPIKKFQSGYYLIINFLFNPEKLEELYSLLKHKEEILRYIIVFAPEEKTRPFTKKKTEQKIEKIEKLASLASLRSGPAGGPKETAKEKEKVEKKVGKKEKIQLEEIDKKLDEILGM